MHSKKGQVSFEALFILLVCLTAAAYITTLYISTDEVTTITAIARNELTAQANSFDKAYIIIKVEADINYSNSTAAIDVTTSPTTLYPAEFDWTRVKEKINEKMQITSINATVNGLTLTGQ